MKLLLKNAKILKEPYADITEGDIRIADGKIVGVGPAQSFAADTVRDLGGKLVMSGFADAHAHSAMTLFRGIADDLPLHEWLFERIFPLEAHLTAEDVYWGSMLAAAEYVRSGITAVADMYFYNAAIAEALNKAGIAVLLCGGSNDIGGEDAKAKLEELENNYLNFNNKCERLRYMLGLHAEYTCSSELIEGTADLAAKYSAPVYIHLAETLKEVGECSVRRGMTPTEYLVKVGFFDNGGIAAHCTYVDKDDAALLAARGVYAASCPSSNLKLASGVAQIATLVGEGVNVVLGTDGAASNNKLSMFREAYLLSVLQKERMKDASAVAAEYALAAATCRGYSALGFAGGKVEKGYAADLVVIDTDEPSMQPPHNIKKSVVFAADTSAVKMTIADGRIVYENGAYNIGEDISVIRRMAKKCAERLMREAGING